MYYESQKEREDDYDRYDDGAKGPMQTVKTIKTILDESPYKGSLKTKEMVASQIEERFCAQAVKEYDPYQNCFTFREWLRRGYKVKKGERALRSVTYVEKRDPMGNVIKKYPKTVCLFYVLQVNPI